MQVGFLARTPQGRIVTPAAYKHLGIKQKNGEQEKLI
jgi:Holliday junction DNA helicase RuvB